MSASPDICPGMSFQDLEFKLLVVILRPSKNPDWWETIVLDEKGNIVFALESVWVIRDLVSKKTADTKVMHIR